MDTVEVEAAYYSVSHTLVGQHVRAQWDDHLVRVYHIGSDGQRQAVAVDLRVTPAATPPRVNIDSCIDQRVKPRTRPFCSARPNTSLHRRWRGPGR